MSATLDPVFRMFRWLCLMLALSGFIGVVTVSLPLSVVSDEGRILLRVVRSCDWLVVGVAVFFAGLSLLATWRDRHPRAHLPSVQGRENLRLGLAVYVSLSFFSFEIGKLAHDAQMREFFLGSGYPVWFMYAVMAAEVAGALALLFRRTCLLAAAGLGAVMVGAIFTHWRNGDPVSDSLDALRMLVLLASLATVELPRHR